jgi:protein-tyrosine sulfotransferase
MHPTIWRDGAYLSEAAPILIGGCGRSGTTLLRVILDSHPNLCCGPESNLFLVGKTHRLNLEEIAFRFDFSAARIVEMQRSSASLAEFIDRFFAAYALARGKPRWAEKTPKDVTVLDFIFAHFPQAKFLHVIRDGRDVACSLRTHPRHQVVDGQLVPLHTRNPWELGVTRWVDDVRAGRAFRLDARYREIRYEEVIGKPEPTLRALFEFIGEPWDDRVLKFHAERGSSRDVRKFPQNPEATRALYADAVSRWRTEMTRAEADIFKARAGALLIELGYEADNSWYPGEREGV